MAAPWATDTFERHKHRHPHASGTSGKSLSNYYSTTTNICPPLRHSYPVSADPDNHKLCLSEVLGWGREKRNEKTETLESEPFCRCSTVVGHKSQWRMQQQKEQQQLAVISLNWTSIFMAGLPLIATIYEFDKCSAGHKASQQKKRVKTRQLIWCHKVTQSICRQYASQLSEKRRERRVERDWDNKRTREREKGTFSYFYSQFTGNSTTNKWEAQREVGV